MSTLRTLRQPGPAPSERIEAVRGPLTRLGFSLRPGATLAEAIAAPLIEAGLQSAAVRLAGTALHPFRYVIPAVSPDDAHVAYFSPPREAAGVSRIEIARATFGWNGGAPAVHCHAVWRDAEGRVGGGHILTDQTRIAAPAEATAIGFRGIRLETRPDAETNFPLLRPAGCDQPGAGLLARVAPNLDILAAIEELAARHGLRDAAIHGTLGSLVGASFTDGTRIADDATEVLVRQGRVRDGTATLELLAADMRGDVHRGWLARGRNAVCITFDLVLEASAG